MKHVLFRIFHIYGNYGVLIDSRFLRNLCFDSDFNRIFDYVHGTHCLSSVSTNTTNMKWLGLIEMFGLEFHIASQIKYSKYDVSKSC